jgi:Skp family chaperone for outer membrane proteins
VLRFQRLASRTETAPGEWIGQVGSLANRLGLRACPDVRVTDATLPPTVWAIGKRTMLLVPRTLLARLGAEQRATLLSHELAHIRRGDLYVRWFEAIVLGLYWWHPVAWLACRALHRAAERCCDDWVLRLWPGGNRSYASTLLETAEFLTETRCALPLGASGFGRTCPLSRRIEMILKGRTYGRSSRRSRVMAALAVAAVLSVSPALMYGGDSPAPPEAKSKPCLSETPLACPEVSAKTSAARNVVVIDVTYLFQHHDGFRRSMQSFKMSVEAAEVRVRQQKEKLTDLQRQIAEAPKGTPERSALEARASALQRDAEALIKAQKKEFLQKEMEIYGATWNEVNAAITQYAKQHHIDLVLRHKKPQDAKQRKKPKNEGEELLQRMNAPVLYQSDAANGDEVEITREVLAQLNHGPAGCK